MKLVAPYSLLARDYDREVGHIFETFQRPLLEDLLGDLSIRGSRALDLACGTGRVACFLRRCGFSVMGLDRSWAMLEIARRRRGADRVFWMQADMTCFSLATAFQFVCCNFDSVNQLTAPAEVRRLFGLVSRHLSTGGVFLFDVNTRHALMTTWTELSRVIDGDTYVAVWKAGFDVTRDVATLTADYFVRGADNLYEHQREVHEEHPYSLEQLQKWLFDNGLRLERTFADGRWTVPAPDHRRVAYICRKF